MTPHHSSAPRQNSDAELRAFQDLCDRLAGFSPDVSFEWVDGFLTALAAGPRVPPFEVWIRALCDDAYERAFGDPVDETQARRTLTMRLRVLCDQLEPGALMDDPGALRLNPLVAEWTEADRARLVEAGELSAEDAARLLTGAEWADGFLDGVEAFPDLWTEPPDEGAAEIFGELVDQIAVLSLPPAEDVYREHLARYHPKGEPTRDDLLEQACWAAQDLRLYWLDRAPKPATRRVETTPGRNDPCSCGSGKKYKKCCGAATS